MPKSCDEPTENRFSELMERVREGSQEAAAELCAEYGKHILHAVRRRLDRQLRVKFDSTDFVQNVWASFFARRDRLPGFESPQALIAFLTAVASNKVVDEYRRRHRSAKYNMQRERPLDVPVVDGGPTASQVAIAKEQWQQIIDGEGSRDRAIADLRYAGATYQEIADQLGVDERTVRRVMKRLSRKVGD